MLPPTVNTRSKEKLYAVDWALVVKSDSDPQTRSCSNPMLPPYIDNFSKELPLDFDWAVAVNICHQI